MEKRKRLTFTRDDGSHWTWAHKAEIVERLAYYEELEEMGRMKQINAVVDAVRLMDREDMISTLSLAVIYWAAEESGRQPIEVARAVADNVRETIMVSGEPDEKWK